MAQETIMGHGDKVEIFRLLSGHIIPAVGLGTWRSASQAQESVFHALVKAGYRHIDTAAEYGDQVEIQREGIRDVSLRIKRNISLKRVMMAYCERVTLEYEGTRFTYNGERIKAEQTAKELGMEDDDVIDVWSDQSGGGAGRGGGGGGKLDI